MACLHAYTKKRTRIDRDASKRITIELVRESSILARSISSELVWVAWNRISPSVLCFAVDISTVSQELEARRTNRDQSFITARFWSYLPVSLPRALRPIAYEAHPVLCSPFSTLKTKKEKEEKYVPCKQDSQYSFEIFVRHLDRVFHRCARYRFNLRRFCQMNQNMKQSFLLIWSVLFSLPIYVGAIIPGQSNAPQSAGALHA